VVLAAFAALAAADSASNLSSSHHMACIAQHSTQSADCQQRTVGGMGMPTRCQQT
jgi:hypothetical protein